MKYSHPQAVYQWIHVDFSVKQVWCEWKWMGFAAVVHTEVLVKKQLGHWDQENTLPIFARVRAIALPSPPREIEMKNWMNVYIDNSSWYFFPALFKLLSSFCLTFTVLCAVLLKHSILAWDSSQFSLCSLLCILILRGYSEIIIFSVWVGTLKYVSYRWADGVLAVHIGFTQTSLWSLMPGTCCRPSHLWGAYGVLWIFEHSSGLIFMPAGAWGAVGLVSISIAALLSLWQGAAWGGSCCWGAWVGWDRAGAHEISLLRAPGQQPPLITRPGGHETIPDIYSHPSALCRKTQNCMKNLVKPCIWLHH